MEHFAALASFVVETFLVCATIVAFFAIIAFTFCGVVLVGAKVYHTVCGVIDGDGDGE